MAANTAGRGWVERRKVDQDQADRGRAGQGQAGRRRADWGMVAPTDHQQEPRLDRGLDRVGHRQAGPAARSDTAERLPVGDNPVSAELIPAAVLAPDGRRERSETGRTEGSPVAAGRCCSRILPLRHTSDVLGFSLGYGPADAFRTCRLRQGRTIPGHSVGCLWRPRVDLLWRRVRILINSSLPQQSGR